MRKYFINGEIKVTFISLSIMLVVSLGVSLIGLNLTLSSINRNIVKQDIEITGKLVERYPQLKEGMIDTIKEPTKANHIKMGTELLSQYGYSEDMPFKFQSSLNGVYMKMILEIIIFFILVAMGIFLIVFKGFSKVYSKVAEVTSTMEKVIDGDFSYCLKEEGEEFFDKLGYQFNKMANCLKLNIDTLKKEKVFLKNSIEDISHQLKTPVATLIAANDIMAAEVEMPVETRAYFIERSKKQLERIEWLVKNLLKLAMLDAGIIVFSKAKIPAISMVERAISSIEYLREAKNISISIHENIPDASFYGDANWTGEAILNIVKNSIEHTAENGMIHINIEQMKLMTTICISDNGEGIEQQEITKIFERFHKCKSKYKEDSVGIGLSLSQRIIEGQGGTITVESEKGKGSCFTIVLMNE